MVQGTEPPRSEQLASQLEGRLPSEVGTLRAFLKRHPEHLEARQRLTDLLRSRMPNPGLEPLLMETAAAGCLTIRPDERWQPLAGRYLESAKRATPEIESLLPRMPGNIPLWEALWQWGSLLSTPPDLAALASAIPPPPGTRAATGMPDSAMDALMPQLRRSKAFEMVIRLAKPRLEKLRRLRPDQDRASLARVFRKHILPAYAEALNQLGRLQEARQAAQELDGAEAPGAS